MSVRLRVVLDQSAAPASSDQAEAARELTAALVATAPVGCEVEAIVPSDVTVEIPGVGAVRTLSVSRARVLATWPLGLVTGVGAGLIHAPSLLAPLVRHDRVHNLHQIAVTLWDLRAWESPDQLTRNEVAWQKAMLKRAVKHADAVVVPSHHMAEGLEQIVPRLANRIHVIAGAVPAEFVSALNDGNAANPESGYVVLFGSASTLESGFRAVADAYCDVIVMDVPVGEEGSVTELASAAGVGGQRLKVIGWLPAAERAELLKNASVCVAVDTAQRWPWRVLESITAGTAVVAVDSGVHQDVLADGGLVVPAEHLAEAVEHALGDGAERLRILASDRARAYSWAGSAEQVWRLHADL